MFLANCRRAVQQGIQQREPYNLRWDNDSLVYCDKRGGRALNLQTAEDTAHEAACTPVAEPNTAALIPQLRRLGMDTAGLQRVFATFNVATPGFTRARDQAAEAPRGERAAGDQAG